MVRIIEYYMKYLFVFAPKRYSFIARVEVVYRNLYILIVYLTTLSQYLRLYGIERKYYMWTMNRKGCGRKWSWSTLSNYTAFAWRSWGKPRKTSVTIAGLRAEILTRILLNTKQGCWPLGHDVRWESWGLITIRYYCRLRRLYRLKEKCWLIINKSCGGITGRMVPFLEHKFGHLSWRTEQTHAEPRLPELLVPRLNGNLDVIVSTFFSLRVSSPDCMTKSKYKHNYEPKH
jgi:hypothetical protein